MSQRRPPGGAPHLRRSHTRPRCFAFILLCVALAAPTRAVAARIDPAPASPQATWQCDPSGGPACFAPLYGIDMVSSTDGWAVGEGGVILHWDGTQWLRAPSPTRDTLHAIDMVSATAGWAGGGNREGHSTGLYYDGTAWQSIGAGTSAGLTSLSMVPAGDGWAVGYRFVPYGNSFNDVLRWDGTAWQVFASNVADREPLVAVSIASPDRGWLASTSKVLQWDGVRWGYGTAEWADSPIGLNDVAADAQGGGWGVGEGFLRLDPLEQWPTIVTAPLQAVRLLAPDDGWAVGDAGAIYHWDGAEWSRVTSPTEARLNALAFASPADGWAVGANGAIIRWDGIAWRVWAAGSPNARLYSVHMISAHDGWAVGDGGAILRWDGVSWRRQASPTTARLRSVSFLTTDEGWAVGDEETLLHWNGSAWHSIKGPPGTYELYSVDILSPTDAWAVGQYQHSSSWILHWDGDRWAQVASPSPYNNWLNAVDMVSPADGWAVGGYIPILRWNGAEWINTINPTSQRTLSVKMLSPTDGWIVGCYGIFHWDGLAWQMQYLPICLQSVDMVSPTDGWAVGNGGELLHWDGVSWEAYPEPAPATLFDVSLVSPTEGWAVGDGGILLRYSIEARAPRRTYLPLLIRG